MVWDEANLVTERENARVVTEVSLIRLAISANLGKDGDRQYQKAIKALNISVEPYEDPEG